MLTFPFGMPIMPVQQADRSPKRVFVLGVYASAVHARWRGSGERILNYFKCLSETWRLSMSSDKYDCPTGKSSRLVNSRLICT